MNRTPSASAEDYLKALYALSTAPDASERVNTKAIADRLSLSQPSVTSMLKSLQKQGLVSYASYRGAALTADGRTEALRVIRKHRLIEVFLHRMLGYSWSEVHDEAERLEHAVSDTLIDRMDAALGFPDFDPHGDPIPGRDLTMRSHDAVCLLEIEPPCEVTIKRVMSQDSAVLDWLGQRGIRPGAPIRLVHLSPFDGPAEIAIDDRAIHLGRGLASMLRVRPVDAD